MLVNGQNLTGIKQQIHDWFKNRRNRTKTTDQGATAAWIRGKKVLDLSNKKPKLLPAWQAYSKLYWRPKLKEIVKEKWKTKYLRKHPNCNPNKIPEYEIDFRNRVIRDCLAEESQEFRDEIDDIRQRWQQEQANDNGVIDDATDDEEDINDEERAARKLLRKTQK